MTHFSSSSCLPTTCRLGEKDLPTFKGQQVVKWDTALHFLSYLVDFWESRFLIHLIRFVDKETQYSKHVESYDINWAGSHTYGEQLQFLFRFQWLQFMGKQTVLKRPDKWRFLKKRKFYLHIHTEIHSMRSTRSVTEYLNLCFDVFSHIGQLWCLSW